MHGPKHRSALLGYTQRSLVCLVRCGVQASDGMVPENVLYLTRAKVLFDQRRLNLHYMTPAKRAQIVRELLQRHRRVATAHVGVTLIGETDLDTIIDILVGRRA